MKNYASAILAVLTIACSTKNKTSENTTSSNETRQPTLELAWETDAVMTTAENVLYDQSRDVLYVANINEGPWEKDSSGFISKLSTTGEILDHKWVQGLDAPKGMAISGNSLFVNDIDQLVEIDIEAGEIIKRLKFDDDPNINGLTVSEQGVLFAAGSKSFKIYRIENDTIEVLLEGDLGRPNGVLAEKDRLLMLTNHTQKLISIDYQTKAMTTLADSLGHVDGIAPVGNGGYIVSSWKGQVFYLSQKMERSLLLDTREEEINAADIAYIQDKNLLLVPTFFDNRVKAYRLLMP